MKLDSLELTVVTVCWNVVNGGRANSMRNCLESVRSQTYRKFEHLVVDGGSKDGTLELLKEYGDYGELRVVSEPDHGIYDAMNKAIGMARGKYTVFLNSDDAFSDTDAVSAFMKALERDDADYLFANADVYSADHSQLKYVWKSSIDDIPFGYYPCHQTLVCRTEVLRKIGGFTENYLANDNLLMLKLVARNYSCSYLDRSIVNFHVGGASGDMIAKKEQMRCEHIEFFMAEFGKRAGLSEQDCLCLYERNFQDMSFVEALDLGSRLIKPRWIKRFFSILCEQRVATPMAAPVARQARARLFGKLPLFGVDIPV